LLRAQASWRLFLLVDPVVVEQLLLPVELLPVVPLLKKR
jgi:hypothetical protein